MSERASEPSASAASAAWPAPIMITSRIALVGSGSLGFSLTDAHDSHVYLVDGSSDAVIIDAGCGLASERIADNIRAVIGSRQVSRILLTHAHADHAGGAASLGAALQAEVLALPEVASIVAAADEDASGLRRARESGTYPASLRLTASDVAPLREAALDVGDLRMDVLHTPGHAAGHACFLLQQPGRRTLFSGDLVFARGRVAVLATPDTDLDALARSIRLVTEAAPDVLLPGHGEPVLRQAATHLQSAVRRLDSGQLPPALLP